MKDVALFLMRLTMGGLLTGHGAQKLLGWFGGPGLKGTAGWLESMGMKPGSLWARAAALSEFGGGLLTTLGLFNPLGPIATLMAMLMATRKAHWGKPIWVTEGGAELPVTNSAIALGLALAGPGKFSLDRLFGIKLPKWAIGTAVLMASIGLLLGMIGDLEELVEEVESRVESLPQGIASGDGLEYEREEEFEYEMA